MGTPLKFAVAAVILGGLAFIVNATTQKLSQWASKITYKIISIGSPIISAGKATLPLRVSISSPSILYVPIQDIKASIFYLKNGMWVPFARANSGAFELTQGTIEKTIYPVLDLSKLTGLVNQNIATVLNFLTQKSELLTIKCDVVINIQGVDLPTQSFQQKIFLTDLLRNVA